MEKKSNKTKKGKQSLASIMKRIEPFLPKTRKIEIEPPRNWKVVSNGTLPPLNSTMQG